MDKIKLPENWNKMDRAEKFSYLKKELTIIKMQEAQEKGEILTEEVKERIIKEVISESKEKLKNPHKPEIEFDYEFLETKVTTLTELEAIIKRNFPTIWFETKACLSTCGCMALKHLNGCPSLNLVGNPSGEKTTILSFFYGQKETYLSDDFSPRAFVSHSANMKSGELESVDLLPKLKNKILITPELAPLFEAQKEKLIDNFAMLTRVLDGEGLNRDSGTHGHRGYSGDFKFAWLGATTPIRSSVWQIMGKIGNRLFFLNMSEKNRNNQDYVNMFLETPYEQKVKECRGAIRSFLNNFFKKYPIRSFDWANISQDVFVLTEISNYAILLSKLRGSLTTWKSHGEDKSDYEHTFPIIEEPPRAINSLLNLARGHALIHGRDYLHTDDLEIVRKVCLSSMPYDRYMFLKLLMKHEGRLTTNVIESELKCSKDNALRTMKIFEVLGVVDIKKLPVEYGGAPMHYIELKPEFMPLLQPSQGRNPAINSKSQEINDERFLDKGNTHGLNPAINSKSQEIHSGRGEFDFDLGDTSEDIDFSKSGIKEFLEDGQ